MIKVPISDVGMIDDLLRRSVDPLCAPLDVPLLLVMLMPLVPPAAAACDCFRDRIIISFHLQVLSLSLAFITSKLSKIEQELSSR
jgi:hypothetical protein